MGRVVRKNRRRVIQIEDQGSGSLCGSSKSLVAARDIATMLCRYCNSAPPIRESHVVPRFMGEHIKRNSPFGHLLNTWCRKPVFDLHKGPYLCATCDNELFSSWENFFSKSIWCDPLAPNAKWSDERSIKFALSLAYRYAIHFIETSPIATHKPYSEFMRDLTRTALKDNSHVDRNIFIYPYIHRAISAECSLIHGVNHLLSLAVHAENLPQEGDLPNSMLVVVPKVIFLFCDRNLSACSDNKITNPSSLSVGAAFNATTANANMPVFISSVLNRIIGQGQAQQKQLGRWKRMAYGTDKLLNPKKICYVAQKQDQDLLDWQKSNCGLQQIQRIVPRRIQGDF